MELVIGLLCVVVLGQSAVIVGFAWAALRKQGVVAPILPVKKPEQETPRERNVAFFHGVGGQVSSTTFAGK